MIKDTLLKAGLSENEIKMYIASLELGEATIARLAKKSGIKRSTTYLVLESLASKELIGITKRRKKSFFYAENPAIIKEIMQENLKEVDSIIPELLSIANLIDKKPSIRYYEGIEGIKEIYNDTLRHPGQEMLTWFSKEHFEQLGDDYFFKDYMPKRVKKKIFNRVIIANAPDAMDKLVPYDVQSLRKTKLIQNEQLKIRIVLMLYGTSKIGITSYEDGFGMVIESQKIFETIRSFFEVMWAIGK